METVLKNINVLEQEKNKIIFLALNLFLFYVAIYFLTASGSNFYSTDASQLRLQVVKSIVERSDLSVPEGWMGADGRNYSVHGIGSVIIAIPFYFVGKFIGIPEVSVSILNQLFGAGTVILIFLFCITLGYSLRASLLVCIFYGLGTMAWPLAKQPFDHVIETFFVLLSVYCMYLSMMNKRLLYLVFSACSFGFAFITRSVSILVIPPLFTLMIIYLSKQSDIKVKMKLITRNIIIFSIAFLPFLGIFFWYNFCRFGSIFETGYHLMAMRLGVDFFTGIPLFTGLSGLLISPSKGFFYYSPVAILFFFSIKSFMKKHLVLCVSFILIMLSYLLFLSKNIYWHGDWAWGPRYILALTPFFIIPLAELFDSRAWKKRKFIRLAIYSIFTLGLIIQIAAVSVDFQKYFLQLHYEKKVKFTEKHGNGALPIVEPPADVYFNWHKSPISAQFISIYEIAKGITNYRYSELPDDTKNAERIKASLFMNVFDFWWLYKYYVDRSYTCFYIALILLIITIYAAKNLWRLTLKSS